ncbi:MAG: basic secretory protein-like protein [Pirellulales bacterium]
MSIRFSAAALCLITACYAFVVPVSRADVTVTVERLEAGSGLTFSKLPRPAINDAASTAYFTILDGTRDPNGRNLDVLHDGRVAAGEDEPKANFFFAQGTSGGRILIDLRSVIDIREINTYSAHTSTRGPQVYKLYAADGTAPAFEKELKAGSDPVAVGWRLIASVDTRPAEGSYGGTYAVSLTDAAGSIGKARYVLWEIDRTESRDTFGNTFYGEIDILDVAGPKPMPAPVEEASTITFKSVDDKVRFAIDVTQAPELAEWSVNELKPVVAQWYPKIVELLPSDGFKAATEVTLTFRNDMGGVPAYAQGNRVSMNAAWFRNELKREARGAVVHELVHVVQDYSRANRRDGRGSRPPGWLTEGIPDYIRWFLYEPETKGAELNQRTLATARHDTGYRVSANFLNWVTEKHDKEIVRIVNESLRSGNYDEALWKERTGLTLEELSAKWKEDLRAKLEAK